MNNYEYAEMVRKRTLKEFMENAEKMKNIMEYFPDYAVTNDEHCFYCGVRIDDCGNGFTIIERDGVKALVFSCHCCNDCVVDFAASDEDIEKHNEKYKPY